MNLSYSNQTVQCLQHKLHHNAVSWSVNVYTFMNRKYSQVRESEHCRFTNPWRSKGLVQHMNVIELQSFRTEQNTFPLFRGSSLSSFSEFVQLLYIERVLRLLVKKHTLRGVYQEKRLVQSLR